MFTLTILNVKGFSELDSDKEQLKELFFIYGLNTSRLALIDDFFINLLKLYRYKYKTEVLGKILDQKEIDKIEKHYIEKATLGILINEFKNAYITNDVDNLFEELLGIRNTVIHPYI